MIQLFTEVLFNHLVRKSSTLVANIFVAIPYSVMRNSLPARTVTLLLPAGEKKTLDADKRLRNIP